MGYGELTKHGKMHMYELGRWLRNRYGAFLSEEYSPKDIYVHSTDVDRTLMSAAANLAGLYPPKNSQIWNEDLPWQPIPIHALPKEEDPYLYFGPQGTGRTCKKFISVYQSVVEGDFFQGVNTEYADFYKEISKLTGWNINDVHYLARLQSVFYVYSRYNSSFLPSWARSIDQVKLNYLTGLNYVRHTYNTDLKRLGVGPFLHRVFTYFDRIIKNPGSTHKFVMLSAHESTVAGALNAMELFDHRAPEFGSCVIWELRRTNRGMNFINVLYKKNSYEDTVLKLKLKDCVVDCGYEHFKNFMKPITLNITEWEEECANVEE